MPPLASLPLPIALPAPAFKKAANGEFFRSFRAFHFARDIAVNGATQCADRKRHYVSLKAGAAFPRCLIRNLNPGDH